MSHGEGKIGGRKKDDGREKVKKQLVEDISQKREWVEQGCMLCALGLTSIPYY